MSDPDLIFFTDEDGYPWACFSWCAVPFESITAARIAKAADHAGIDEDALDLDAFTVTTFWIRRVLDAGDHCDRWLFCSAGDEGARQVTGVRFQ